MSRLICVLLFTWCFIINFVSLTLAIAPIDLEEQPIVVTGLGKIQGNVLKSRLGELFFAFRGIRYAKPPIGELRFKAPEPIEQWNDIFDATVDGPMCPQPNDDESDISEDCLRLNVYTRELPNDNSTARTAIKKPVLVYIHPGGFYSVSGQSKNFAGPQNLMDRDIVLVTMNYRLGSLGFLSTGTKDYPGNAGLKDQSLVLKFIKLHIAQFGGDPNMVTLMGYSAGAISVTLHMVSPMSKGLFHRAIVMSGAATAQWDIDSHQLGLAERQANVLGCPNDSVDNMIDCFNTKTGIEFGNSLPSMFEFGIGNPILVWLPVIEKDYGQERFLTENPTKLFRQGRFMRIPIMAGITEYEFAGPAIAIIHNIPFKFRMDTEFNTLAPICFMYERDTERSNDISQALRKEFLNGPILDDRSLPGLNNLYADGVVGFGVHRFVKLASVYTRVYYYKNSYVGRYSHLYYPANKPYGTVHHDDLLYLFVAPNVAPMFKLNDPENLQVERMTGLWTAFVNKGDPNNENENILENMRWRRMTASRLNYLEIGTELEMKDKLFTDRYDVWDGLFPLPVRRRGKADDSFTTEFYYDTTIEPLESTTTYEEEISTEKFSVTDKDLVVETTTTDGLLEETNPTTTEI